MKRNIIKVTGKVQGVSFRVSTCTQARQLNLRGRVKNESDGSVRIVAEGEEPMLEQFVAWCWRGPALARVESVTVASAPAENCFPGFEIRR